MRSSGHEETRLSPLDQIRLAEAEVTRKIAAARRDCEEILADAKAEAQVLLDSARARGKRRGQVRYREVIAEADEEARGIRAGAEHRANMLRAQGKGRMGLAIHEVVNIVTGMDEGTSEA